MGFTGSISRGIRRVAVPRPGVYRRPSASPIVRAAQRAGASVAATAPGASPPSPTSYPAMAPDLGPEDIQYFTSARNRVQQSRDLALGTQGMTGQIQFERTQLGLDKAQAVADLARQWDQLRNRLPGSFARRGLLNSGIAARGLKDYGVDRTLAESRLGRAYDARAGALDLEQSQVQSVYDQAISDLKAQEEARRASIRASLSGF